MDRHLPIARRSFALRSFDKLAEDAENQVRDILDADDCPAVKSEALYRSFLNTDAIEAAGLDPIRDELDLIDSAIDKAALTRVLGTINPAGGPDLFGLAVYGDPGDPDRNIAHLEQAGLCLPDEAYYARITTLRARSIRGDGRHPAGERRIRARRRVQRWR